MANVINLSTPLGLVVARAGGARLAAADDGLIVAHGYRWALPAAPAFTLGNVIILRIDDEQLARRPKLMLHESRHATQYAMCLGIVMVPLYLAAAGWSWLRCRDFGQHNVFERLAGLADGGYAVLGAERQPSSTTPGEAA